MGFWNLNTPMFVSSFDSKDRDNYYEKKPKKSTNYTQFIKDDMKHTKNMIKSSQNWNNKKSSY